MQGRSSALTRKLYGGRRGGRCNTCHNGHPEPMARPNLDAFAETKPPLASTPHPSAAQIIERFERLVGIRPTGTPIRTRYIRAERIEPDGSKEPEEIWQDSSGRMLVKTTYPSN